MDTVVCGMAQLSVEVESQQGRCWKPTRRATRAHACVSAGTVALAELLTASRCMQSARCRPFSRLTTRSPNFTFRFLFYDRLRNDESTRRGLQQLGFTPFSWAWSTSPHATGSYALLTKTGAPRAMVLWSNAGGVWPVCNPRVLVFGFLRKPKPKPVTPSIAHANDFHHAGYRTTLFSRRRRWNTHDACVD